MSCSRSAGSDQSRPIFTQGFNREPEHHNAEETTGLWRVKRLHVSMPASNNSIRKDWDRRLLIMVTPCKLWYEKSGTPTSRSSSITTITSIRRQNSQNARKNLYRKFTAYRQAHQAHWLANAQPSHGSGHDSSLADWIHAETSTERGPLGRSPSIPPLRT